MTDEDLAAEDRLEGRKHNRKRLTEGSEAMMTWTLFACAALAGGSLTRAAAAAADQMIQETLKRFG